MAGASDVGRVGGDAAGEAGAGSAAEFLLRAGGVEGGGGEADWKWEAVVGRGESGGGEGEDGGGAGRGGGEGGGDEVGREGGGRGVGGGEGEAGGVEEVA